MRSNKATGRLHLIDELMTAAVDDVQICLLENSICTDNDYYDKELEQFPQSNTDIIKTIAKKYVLDIDKLIYFIKHREEHYETASLFGILVDFRKYIQNDSIPSERYNFDITKLKVSMATPLDGGWPDESLKVDLQDILSAYLTIPTNSVTIYKHEST
ncbi:unnamed protein product [Adineta steineri]|uniref:Uncharacterized protein n=1 Tax=Adineta steineri TaxID=433720 RepID=A0A819RTG7_9BILA|nr:unnamed protein product [Adineta steineri]CAF4051147.1 unnamed protein product [Adineta steineri]